MARTRRHRNSPWLLLLALASSLAGHLGSVAVYEATRPPPPHMLRVHIDGRGAGVVSSAPAGMRCTRDCAAPWAPGSSIELQAKPDDTSTFLGWSGDCEPVPERVLACRLVLDADAEVTLGFGRMPREVEVAWVDSDELPESEEQPVELRLPDPDIEAEMLIEPLAEILPEAVPEPPPPELPPPPPEQQPPAPPPPEMANMRSVEVPDENEVEEAPDDATHLSDKNRDVAEETRAEDTNLDRQQSGEAQASAPSEVDSEEIGVEEDTIAELEETDPSTLEDVREEPAATGESERAVGALAGEQGEDGEDGEAGDGTEAPEPGMLAMRGIAGRGALVASEDRSGRGGEQGKRGTPGLPGINTALDADAYERIVGEDKAAEEVELGRRRMSGKRGRFARKQEAIRSALENFTPEVRTGNQTALKTRAAPFAVFIARMHREIHPLWGFGFIEDLNDRPGNDPLNDWNLMTTLEIVVNSDGTVHKVNIVRNSGRLEFDVAAIDTVLTAGPYEPPPPAIRSPDGRAYVHWGFYRNYRQCGTFNAQPFILSEAPEEDPDVLSDSDMVRRMAPSRRQKLLDQARTPEGPAQSGDEDPAATHVANLWMTGYAQGNVARMVQMSATPFRVAGGNVASSGELSALYQRVRREVGGMRDWKMMSPAGYRQRFGSLPEGLEAGEQQLLAVVLGGKGRFALALERRGDDYKVVGLFVSANGE
ncbi:energy transducer TonB [Haliangium ochraceum]|uniref:TonB C-terminal domain-containing protein n=1 Tax=Haliangium ochraceum (strain DSM 14365 / JCM 11303 / SMP-2) TaxID=502025 RepID=D0LXH6_HALO1|nr:energy transducer TonB [Haliangium ochraceum]ACY17731.1 hypothetical protein Hoch_5246 [Haliangium ochraceum DSM 14365]